MLEVEKSLLRELDQFDFDPSHDKAHLRNVLRNAKLLYSIHGGNLKILSAAVILHDLGRSDLNIHGEASRKRSVELAIPILERNGFTQNEIDQICSAILDHDQFEKTPKTLEARILKEADFLDGFGARGIFRVIAWTVTSGGSLEDVIYALKVRMPERISGLEFPESKEIALTEYKFVEEFLEKLEKG